MTSRLALSDEAPVIRLRPQRILDHRHVVGVFAGAASSAEERQVPQGQIAASAIDDPTEVSWRLAAAGAAPDQNAEIAGAVRAADGR